MIVRALPSALPLVACVACGGASPPRTEMTGSGESMSGEAGEGEGETSGSSGSSSGTSGTTSGSSSGSGTSTSTSTGTGTGSSSTSTGSSSSSGEPPNVCGNSMIEGLEDCDDGNTMAGDDCHVDCVDDRSDGTVWSRTQDGMAMSADAARGVAVDGAGNVVVAGYVADTVGDTQGFLRKYAPDGEELWTRTWMGMANADDRIHGVAVGPDDVIVAAGYVVEEIGNFDVHVAQFDAEGNPGWTDTVDGDAGGDDLANGVAIGADGTVAVVGQVSTADGRDLWVLTYDSAGTPGWTKIWAGADGGEDAGNGVAIASDGSIVVAGFVSTMAAQTNALIVRYDADGNETWTDTMGGPSGADDKALAIAVVPAGGLVVAGYLTQGAGGNNVWWRRYDATDQVVASETFNSPVGEDDRGQAVAVASDGTIVVAGYREVVANDSDAFVRRYDENGVLAWMQSFGGAPGADDQAWAVALGADGTVAVAGELQTVADKSDLWVATLAP